MTPVRGAYAERYEGTYMPIPRVDGETHIIYAILRADSNAVKLGITRQVRTRLALLQGANDEPLTLLLAFPSVPRTERDLFVRFADFRKRGEWFHAAAPLMDWIDRQRARCLWEGFAPANEDGAGQWGWPAGFDVPICQDRNGPATGADTPREPETEVQS